MRTSLWNRMCHICFTSIIIFSLKDKIIKNYTVLISHLIILKVFDFFSNGSQLWYPVTGRLSLHQDHLMLFMLLFSFPAHVQSSVLQWHEQQDCMSNNQKAVEFYQHRSTVECFTMHVLKCSCSKLAVKRTFCEKRNKRIFHNVNY